MKIRVIQAKDGSFRAELVQSLVKDGLDPFLGLQQRDVIRVEWRNDDPRKQLMRQQWWKSLPEDIREECLAVIDHYMLHNQIAFKVHVVFYEQLGEAG